MKIKKKKVKVGFLVAVALVIPAFYVVMEYLRSWRSALNVLIRPNKQGW